MSARADERAVVEKESSVAASRTLSARLAT